ncbi:MAG: PPC domain-containing protein [Chloroflexota bacterium]
MKYIVRLLILYSLIWLVPTLAQDDATSESIDIGTIIEGRIDDSTPRIAYSLNGTRGAIVRVRLTATNGSLDPVLLIFNPAGDLIINRDDSAGTRNIDLTITFQENGAYTLVVGRFGYSLGTTSGDYDLSIERIGISSDEGSSLQYGIAIQNIITNTQPRLFFTFEANAGDIINISMTRSGGTLDPYLQLLDSNRFVIAENDDFNDNTFNARIQTFVIQEAGTYIIVASRYREASGDSAGSFVLLVEEATNSGLGNSQLAPAGIVFDQTITAELTENRYERFYVFEGQRDQVISISMERTGFAGQLDAYLILANAGFQPLIEDDDGGTGSSALINEYRLPADGLYYIIATRFEREAGTTFGEYNLTVTDEGSAFAGVPPEIPRLLYGTTLQDTITFDDTDSLFVFWGTEGERVIISMDQTSGTLNPVIELLDSQQIRMVLDDDSGFENNARLDTVLTYTGVHYIRATRYEGNASNPNTTGDYRLSLTRIVNSDG